MKRLFLGIAVFFLSCSNVFQDYTKAVRTTKYLYGGICKIKHGTTFKTNDKNNIFIEINISKSDFLNAFPKNKLNIPASNIARIFLEKTNKNSMLNEIKVNIKQQNNDVEYFTFNPKKIQNFIKNKFVFETANYFLVHRNFDDLHNLFDDEVKSIVSLDDLNKTLVDISTKYGEVTGVINQGFEISNAEFNNKKVQLISYFGTVKRTKQNTQISYYVASKTQKILGIQFEW